MNNQPQQRFCTSCGQSLAPGTAFCVACGTQVSTPSMGAPGQFSAGAQPGGPPPYAPAPGQAQDDVLLAGLAAGFVANQAARSAQMQVGQRRRRPVSRLSACGCILLVLAVLVGPFIGVALTTGSLHTIFTYVAVGLVGLILLVVLVVMLATRRGREFLFEAVLDGLLNGG